MAFLRSVVTTKAAIAAATVLPAATFAFSSSSSSRFPSQLSKAPDFSLNSTVRPDRLALLKSLTGPPFAIQMDAHAPLSDQKSTLQNGAGFPEVMTEFMVDMKSEGCVNAVKNKLRTVDGVRNVEVDLSNQVVRILGSSPVKTITQALEQTGRKARLIGQGNPDDFLSSAAVAEFKGSDIFGVVRLAQVNMELARIEANFSGLSPGKHCWSINEFGDLTKGAASTGKVFTSTKGTIEKEPVGDLGTLDVDENGETFFSCVKHKLRVADLIGRSIVVYGTEDRSASGMIAAVIARSAGVGENYKKICTCDGTTIWEAKDRDFVTSKVLVE